VCRSHSQDLYQLLGVQKECTQEDIKRAYRKVTAELLCSRRSTVGAVAHYLFTLSQCLSLSCANTGLPTGRVVLAICQTASMLAIGQLVCAGCRPTHCMCEQVCSCAGWASPVHAKMEMSAGGASPYRCCCWASSDCW